ncbi:MAG: RrF2 family transcriptional regulator [Gaiellaceae bacterium]
MRLRFSRTADYGLRAALEVALTPDDELVTRHAIARAVGAPPSVLAQALSLLARAHLLVAQAGPHGGYRLARPAAEISIRDVVAAVDGPEPEQRCVLREGVCSSSGPCPFHEFLVAAQGRFLEVMRGTSLADVIAGIDRLEKEGSQQ